MSAKRLRIAAALAISLIFLLAWMFPILWSFLNSLKTDKDVLAYPPKVLFTPTLDAYREVLFGSASILPNLVSSFIISIGTTVITMKMTLPSTKANSTPVGINCANRGWHASSRLASFIQAGS